MVYGAVVKIEEASIQGKKNERRVGSRKGERGGRLDKQKVSRRLVRGPAGVVDALLRFIVEPREFVLGQVNSEVVRLDLIIACEKRYFCRNWQLSNSLDTRKETFCAAPL